MSTMQPIQTDLRSRIIRASDPITVEHPAVLLVGQPGICKTSLAFSAKQPLLLDFDGGVHRAVNRRDTWPITCWSDAEDLTEHPEILDPYTTIVVDTVGRCVELMSAEIMRSIPKYGRDGNLTQQGWGVLKNRFRVWKNRMQTMGKDVLMLAHAKEDRDGDVTVLRPEIPGGSYAEVMKTADFVGTIYISGKNRMLDFNPTDRWIGKNPAGWDVMRIPPADKATSFVAELFDLGRNALGKISDASAAIAKQVDEWRRYIEGLTNCAECNRAIPEIKKLSPILLPQVSKILMDHAAAKGIPFDRETRQFTHPAMTAQPMQETF